MVSALTVFLLSIVTFVLLRITPGSPCAPYGMITREQCRAIEQDMGYDKPYFPISVDLSNTGDWWLLFAPLALVLAGWLVRRRLIANR
jgi:ABC-type dipeptide/oligopeptide/nickel transport system permease component